MIALALAASLVTAPPAAPAPPKCPGDSTPEINACASAELDAYDAALARYVAAARHRLQENATPDDVATLKAFDKAETAWAAYRVAECDAVYANWVEGTIRTVMALDCEIDLTVRHTHTVWANWLTYMDSTPPILPEPPAAPPSE